MDVRQSASFLIKKAVLRYLAGSPAVSHYPEGAQNFVAGRMATEAVTSRAPDYARRMMFGVAGKQLSSGIPSYQVSNNLENMAKKAPNTPTGRAALEVAMSLTGQIAEESGSPSPIAADSSAAFKGNVAAAGQPAPFDREMRNLAKTPGLPGEQAVSQKIEAGLAAKPPEDVFAAFDNMSPQKLLKQPTTEVNIPPERAPIQIPKPSSWKSKLGKMLMRKRASNEVLITA